MAPQSTAKKKLALYGLLALGFAGLIGAHEWAVGWPFGAASRTIAPFLLAALGTLSFVAAGLLARKLMKQESPK